MRPVWNRFAYWLILSLSLVTIYPTIDAQAFQDSSWISCGYQDNSYSLGFFGYRIQDHAVELGALISDDTGYGLPGYGLDYLFFKDLSDETAIYGGIGLYRRYYLDDTGGFKGRTEWAYSIGAQHDFFQALGLGFGYHSIRGVNLQVKLGF
ncbi:MAG TPA: hypothetical protein VF531_06800 [Bacillota bacterium]